MSSQSQWHKLRKGFKKALKASSEDMEVRMMLIEDNDRLQKRIDWLQRRPPWWKFWAVRKWKEAEPR